MNEQPTSTLENQGMPEIGQKPKNNKKSPFVFVIFCVVIGCAGFFIFLNQKDDAKPEVQNNKTATQPTVARVFSFDTPPPPPQNEPPAVAIPVAPTLPTTETSQRSTLGIDKSASSLMVSSGNVASGGGLGLASSDSQLPQAQARTSGSLGNAPLFPSGEGGIENDLSARMTPTRTQARQAGLIGNRNFLLAKGSFIDCILQTRLDSTVPGMTSCVVTTNVYSDNGKVLLIERGSTISGEYASNIKQGQSRLFVLWNRVKTPNGVVINLDSSGTDSLGGAGVEGYVDTHFWKRFGGAILLSLIDDTAAALTSSSSSSDSNINLNNTAGASSEMATEALRNSINIPPTLSKNQGERIGIYVSRDLSFESVYKLEVSNE